MKKNINDVIESINEMASMLNTLEVDYDSKEDVIVLYLRKYNGNGTGRATYAQARYATSLSNVECKYKSRLCKTNKWALSKAIDVARMYGDYKFYFDV